MNLDQLGAQALGHITAGDRAHDKAEQHYKSAGLYLIEAKKLVDRRRDMTWPQFLLAHCNIGKSRSYELIAIADGRKSLEEIREEKRSSVEELRERDRRNRQDLSTSSGQPPRKTQRKQQKPPKDPEERERAAIVARITARLRNLTTDQLLTLERIVPNADDHHNSHPPQPPWPLCGRSSRPAPLHR